FHAIKAGTTLNICKILSIKKGHLRIVKAVSRFFCTLGRSRTGTSVTSLVFETNASTNSATKAFVNRQKNPSLNVSVTSLTGCKYGKSIFVMQYTNTTSGTFFCSYHTSL